MHVIDIRGSDNQLVILGGAMSLPTSDNTASSPLSGSIRWNSTSKQIEFYNNGWNSIASTTTLASLSDVAFNTPSQNQIIYYDSGSSKWKNQSPPYDIYGTFLGNPTDGQTLWRIVLARAITLPLNLAGSVAVCSVAPIGNITLPILRNGSQIGTINFAASATTATFTFSSSITFSSGDLLEIDGPSPADAGFVSPSWCFLGYR